VAQGDEYQGIPVRVGPDDDFRPYDLGRTGTVVHQYLLRPGVGELLADDARGAVAAAARRNRHDQPDRPAGVAGGRIALRLREDDAARGSENDRRGAGKYRMGSHESPVTSHHDCQRIAIGATVDPVAPCSLSGCMTNANSCTRFAASSSSFMFSSRWMPCTTSIIWCIGPESFGSFGGATSTGMLSAPSSIGSCFTSHSPAPTPIPGLALM